MKRPYYASHGWRYHQWSLYGKKWLRAGCPAHSSVTPSLSTSLKYLSFSMYKTRQYLRFLFVFSFLFIASFVSALIGYRFYIAGIPFVFPSLISSSFFTGFSSWKMNSYIDDYLQLKKGTKNLVSSIFSSEYYYITDALEYLDIQEILDIEVLKDKIAKRPSYFRMKKSIRYTVDIET